MAGSRLSRRRLPDGLARRSKGGATIRVLIVDDHLLFAEAIGAALHEAGMGVCASVTNGRDAIAFLETDHADVVLMDIGLPDRSGLAVGREMLERWPETKLVAVTALDDPRAVDEALEAGFRGYLTKDTPIGRWSFPIASFPQVIAAERPTVSLCSSRSSPRGSERSSACSWRGPTEERSRAGWASVATPFGPTFRAS